MKINNTTFFSFLCVFFLAFSLSSCSRDNQIESLSFETDPKGKAYLNMCFTEPFSYSEYLVKFKFKTTKGEIIKTKAQIWGSSNSAYIEEDEKCRKLYGFAYVKGDNEQFQKNRQVFKDSMKSVLIELTYLGEVLSENTFTFN